MDARGRARPGFGGARLRIDLGTEGLSRPTVMSRPTVSPTFESHTSSVTRRP
jgi:hypothetical protein